MSDLAKVLDVLGCSQEEQRILTAEIGTLRRLRVLKKETLSRVDGIGVGIVDEIMYVKDWYLQWKNSGLDTIETIEEAFTERKWDEYIEEVLDQEQKKKDKFEELDLKIKTEELAAATSGGSVNTQRDSGVNVSYKVEAKEIPKLPPNKTLRGQTFDDWHVNFYAKMCQARVDSILRKGYVKPGELDDKYEEYKAKASFLKNHLLTATQNTNAGAWMNARTMDGLDMYKRLLEVFQGEEHDEEAAVNAVEQWELLKFTMNTRMSPETFLAKINECLKRMEVMDKKGNITQPISPFLLPSLFRSKIEHPTFATWKQLSENKKESWDKMQI